MCVVDGEGEQCEYKGEHYNHGFQACYDECHKECKGKKWVCWHGEWYEKGACGSQNGDQCFGVEGETFEDGFHACFDRCHKHCKGNKWICHHGDWLPQGRCTVGDAGHEDDSAYEWSVFRDTSYIKLSRMPQGEMKNACAAVGGTPVTIEDKDENEFVRQLCNIYGPCWIGLAEPPNSEQWRWMDGSPLNFVNWHEGEPNNWGHVDENAAIMSYPPGSRNGEWFDAPSDWDRPVAICKRAPQASGVAYRAAGAVANTDAGSTSVSPLFWMLLGAALALSLLKCFSKYRSVNRAKQFQTEENELNAAE